jgi:hypothetical protein
MTKKVEYEEELVAKLAQQISEEMDRAILDDLQNMHEAERRAKLTSEEREAEDIIAKLKKHPEPKKWWWVPAGVTKQHVELPSRKLTATWATEDITHTSILLPRNTSKKHGKTLKQTK